MGLEKPRASILMPVYNGERYIAEAIESVLIQTFSDWELIVVDDGSSDATPAILAGFADPRIRVIRQDNGGEARARNTALAAAVGGYATFLDADDVYLSNGLADLVGYLERHDSFGVVYSDGFICDEARKPLMRLSEIRPSNYEGNISEYLVVSNIVTVPVCTAIRSNEMRETRLNFDETLGYGTDWDYWIRTSRHTAFGYLDKLTCMYRVHTTNITKTSGLRRRREDLLRVRLKVLNADWFGQLSVVTRRQVFYNLLIDILADNVERQREILAGDAFQVLPVTTQASLLRLTAGGHIRRQADADFAMWCLRRSLVLQPGNMKSRILLEMMSRNPYAARLVLSAWRLAHAAAVRVRYRGRRRPKRVPAALLPVAD